MSWKPPINRRENKSLLNDERFFRLLAKKCARFSDRDKVFLTYMTMVTMLGEELRRHDVAHLPHLGDFGLVEQKPRPGWCGKRHIRMGPKKILRFYPKERLRRYFAYYNASK